MSGSTQQTVRQYVWGLDLSQSLQGAGGVGGLLAAVHGENVYYPCFDANGNITQYVDSSTGTEVARYDYDAFGREFHSSGGLADEFLFRFSTKYTDTETGLVYYGYRYYNPELGRWINRDPIEEEGGLNLYGFVGNRAVIYADYLGLEWGRINSKGIGTSISASSYVKIGASGSLSVQGTIADCCNRITGEIQKHSYFDITVTGEMDVGIGLGGHVKMPIVGRTGVTLRGPQINFSRSVSYFQECGSESPELQIVILNVSADIGGAFDAGGGFGFDVQYFMSYGVRSEIVVGSEYAKLRTLYYASGGLRVTGTTPWIDFHRDYLLDDSRDRENEFFELVVPWKSLVR